MPIRALRTGGDSGGSQRRAVSHAIARIESNQSLCKVCPSSDAASEIQRDNIPVKRYIVDESFNPTYFETYNRYQDKERAVSDPTTLILVDEANRLQMNSLEQMRSIFDEGTAGMVLIGMPSIEKRVARFPQFYSRIGFVHEFRSLDATQMQELLEKRWTPAGVTLPDGQLVPEVIASLIRMTGGNFRLLTRLLTQIERVLNVNNLHLVSTGVVEAARDSFVIGPA
jgi:DNA transposition AAA+ family ATPase